jgi:phage terminase small subunit
MTDTESENDATYITIVELINEGNAAEYIDELRRMANENHVLSMSLLAVFLGDIDSDKHRNEIVKWGEKAHKLGCSIAAEIMVIQYNQWKEPLMSKIWHSRFRE